MTRAPGRLDVMGGIADYSGSLVLQVRFIFFIGLPFQNDMIDHIAGLILITDANKRSLPCCCSKEYSQ